jgi:magnesium transporter
MITTYCVESDHLARHQGFVTNDRFQKASWIDLFEPSVEEEHHLEALLGLELPTREEMRAIEDSSRLYENNGAVYLTANIMVNSESEYPRADDLTFVLTKKCLVTVRYADPKAIRLFASRAEPNSATCASAEVALLGLLETLLERIADSIERVSRDLDDLVHRVLAPDEAPGRRRLDYAVLLRQLERSQILIARARGSLTSLNRLISFVNKPTLEFDLSKSFKPRAATLQHDIQSLMDHTVFLASNISFELAAILGMINIEQNGIIKIFSVAAVVFMPPTLVASIYGMNFDVMPELKFEWGYPLAIGLMLLSAVVTYWSFKRRGWL